MFDGAEIKETKVAQWDLSAGSGGACWVERRQWISGTSLAARLLGRLLSGTDARQRVLPSGHWRTSSETFTTGKERWAFLSPVESHFQ